MKKLLFYAAVSFTFVFAGCSKDSDEPGATGGEYNPLTAGTNWTYTATDGTTAPVTYKLTVTNKDTVANARTYKVLLNTVGANNYMTNIGNNYYRLASYSYLGITNFEDLYLMDNKAVNESWTSTAAFNYSGLPLSATLTYTIKEKGISYTVNNKSYSNVIHVSLALKENSFGNIGGGDFYYASGVGMIANKITITPPPIFVGIPGYTLTQQLVSYEVK